MASFKSNFHLINSLCYKKNKNNLISAYLHLYLHLFSDIFKSVYGSALFPSWQTALESILEACCFCLLLSTRDVYFPGVQQHTNLLEPDVLVKGKPQSLHH